MAIKNLQFIVTVGVDVPDDWECPTGGTEEVQGIIVGVICLHATKLTGDLEVNDIVSVASEFETITD